MSVENKRVSVSFDSFRREVSYVNLSQKFIGDFQIGEKIGQGTFSKVCLGIHLQTKELVSWTVLLKYFI